MEAKKVYVQYGCGFISPKEWVNFDASYTLRFERTPLVGRLYTKNATRFPSGVRIGDIVKGLPILDHSCNGVYASHVLEHLPLDDFHRALENTRRMLAKDGVFRLVVPDLEWAAREYIKRIVDMNAASNEFFLDETALGLRARKRGILGRFFEALSTSRHHWMWDELSLGSALKKHGFRGIRRCCFGDCQDPMFNKVEQAGRFEKSVGMEAIG